MGEALRRRANSNHNGQYDQLIGKIQQRYGCRKKTAEEQFRNWNLELLALPAHVMKIHVSKVATSQIKDKLAQKAATNKNRGNEVRREGKGDRKGNRS